MITQMDLFGYADRLPNSSRKQVWSYGGGTQSVAIAALILQGKIQKPDIAVIADTGMEKRSTWDYMDNVTNPALASIGIKIERVKKTDWENEWSKGDVNGCFAKKGDIMIPVFTDEGGNDGKLRSFCSSSWKREIVDKWLSKTHGLTQSKIEKWIGFSTDEPRRFARLISSDDVYLPLVLGYPSSRSQCVKIVEDMGWPTPPRSNCWMCPNQHDDEWLETIANRPDEFQMAIKIERQVRKIDPHAWFHAQRVPLSEVKFGEKPARTRACDSGECFL